MQERRRARRSVRGDGSGPSSGGSGHARSRQRLRCWSIGAEGAAGGLAVRADIVPLSGSVPSEPEQLRRQDKHPAASFFFRGEQTGAEMREEPPRGLIRFRLPRTRALAKLRLQRRVNVRRFFFDAGT